jgi:mitogen-activated protein kinase 1/3
MIFDLIGTPSKEEIAEIENEEWRKFVQKCKKRKCRDFKKVFPDSNEKAISLLSRLLTFDPKKRITVEQALEHEYLAGLHIESDEPTRDPINPLEFEFEHHRLNGEQLKGKLSRVTSQT